MSAGEEQALVDASRGQPRGNREAQSWGKGEHSLQNLPRAAGGTLPVESIQCFIHPTFKMFQLIEHIKNLRIFSKKADIWLLFKK